MLKITSITAFALAAVGSAFGQDNSEAKSLWNPESQMQAACDGIAARYKLDSNQKQATCDMLTERVTDFLNKHDKELWPLLMELGGYELQGKMPDGNNAKRIANKGYSIFEEAWEEIFSAQTKFHELLNEDQKKIHNRDVKNLRNQHSHMEKQFKSWQRGQVNGRSPLDSVRIGNGRRLGPQRSVPSTVKARQLGDKWEQYVRTFIETYHLDEAQKRQANTFLVEAKSKAEQHRRNYKKEFKQAQEMMSQAKAAKPVNTKGIAMAQKILDAFNGPLENWFQELKDKLDHIPTEKQRQDYLKRNPQMRGRLKKDEGGATKTEKVEKTPAREDKNAPKRPEQPAPKADPAPAEPEPESKPGD